MSESTKNDPVYTPHLYVEFVKEAVSDLAVGQTLTVGDLPVILGRSTECNLRIQHPDISRRHAQLTCESERYIVEDLNSANGTYVNDQRLPAQSPYPLLHDDEINIANVLILRMVDLDMTQRQTTGGAVLPRGLHMVHQQRDVYVRRQRMEPRLADLQYRFLAVLYDNQDRVVSRDEVVAAVWQDATLFMHGVSDAAIDALLLRLRKRLQELDPEHTYIQTVRDVGFQFVQRER